MNCKTCGGELDDVTKKNCSSCRARAREAKNRQRRKRREKQKQTQRRTLNADPIIPAIRKCARCSTVLADDYTRKTCQSCLDRRKADRQQRRCQDCQEPATRLKDGLCARCLGVCTGCLSEKPEGDHWMCEACRTVSRERMARKRQTRKQSGRCPGCGQASETAICERCRERARQYYQSSKRKMMWLKANQLVFQAREDALARGIPCTIGTWAICDLLAEGNYDLDLKTPLRLSVADPKLGFVGGNVIIAT